VRHEPLKPSRKAFHSLYTIGPKCKYIGGEKGRENSRRNKSAQETKPTCVWKKKETHDISCWGNGRERRAEWVDREKVSKKGYKDHAAGGGER